MHQDNIPKLMIFYILITCLLDNVLIIVKRKYMLITLKDCERTCKPLGSSLKITVVGTSVVVEVLEEFRLLLSNQETARALTSTLKIVTPA